MDTSVETTETTMKSGGQFEPAPQALESAYPVNQESALRVVANNLHRLNESIVKAVDVGLSVELIRACRYHNKTGCWGDQDGTNHRTHVTSSASQPRTKGLTAVSLLVTGWCRGWLRHRQDLFSEWVNC